MRKLIARAHILCGGRQYKPGEQLPTGNIELVELWIKYHSAAWAGSDDAHAETAPAAAPSAEVEPAAAAAREETAAPAEDARPKGRNASKAVKA